MAAEDRGGMAVMLTCRDVKKSVEFYKRLGLSMKESWPSETDPQWANMTLGGQSVMIGGVCDVEMIDKMGGTPAETKYWKSLAQAFAEHPCGVGIQVYLAVPDVDAHFAAIAKKGLKAETEPKTQFYGIRDFAVTDPDGYRLVIYTAVAMESCQSCGMPLADAQPGQMYCGYCTDDKGTLKPYEVVFEGTVQGYFMAMQKMSRKDAEQAAKKHLAAMPAWAARS